MTRDEFLKLVCPELSPWQRDMIDAFATVAPDQCLIVWPGRHGRVQVGRVLGVLALLDFYRRCRTEPPRYEIFVDEAASFDSAQADALEAIMPRVDQAVLEADMLARDRDKSLPPVWVLDGFGVWHAAAETFSVSSEARLHCAGIVEYVQRYRWRDSWTDVPVPHCPSCRIAVRGDKSPR